MLTLRSEQGYGVTQRRRCFCRAFDNLRDVRGLEYELDFVTNRANRDLQVTACASGRTPTFIHQCSGPCSSPFLMML